MQHTGPQHGRVVLIVARVHVDSVLQKQLNEFLMTMECCQMDAGQMTWSLSLQLGQYGRLKQLGPSSRTWQSIQKELRQLAIALLGQCVQARLGRFDPSN